MVPESFIAAHREGDLVAIETVVSDADFKGVANTTYIDADAAIRLGEALAALGRAIKRGKVAAGKVLPLAAPYDPYAEDGKGG